MQDYIQIRVEPNPCNEDITDLLAAFLGDVGFESFMPDDYGLTAFVKKELYDSSVVDEILSGFPIATELNVSSSFVKGEDWNQEWEKNYFQPIVIDGKCVVHSTFHKEVPKARYDILIDPKMAFGTGHHSTTSQMMKLILSENLEGKTVIDMGTGTGILSILCKMHGASDVYGIEIDPFACDNARENVMLNGVDAQMICGDALKLAELPNCQLFLANINRNIITSDIDKYSAKLVKGGNMFLSGFYECDIPIVKKAANNVGLEISDHLVDKDWGALRLVKIV